MAIVWKKRRDRAWSYYAWVGKHDGEAKVRFRVYYQPRNKVWAIDRMTYQEGRGSWSFGARTERIGHTATEEEGKELAEAIHALL